MRETQLLKITPVVMLLKHEEYMDGGVIREGKGNKMTKYSNFSRLHERVNRMEILTKQIYMWLYETIRLKVLIRQSYMCIQSQLVV